MPKFESSDILPFRDKDLFALVLDVESYPEFLPWCSEVKLVEKGDGYIIADMKIKFSAFAEEYRSEVRFQDERIYKVEVKAISGPFAYLTNCWNFHNLNNNFTRVDFFIDFDMKSFLLSQAVAIFFKKATVKILESFKLRAEKVISATKD